MYDKKSYTSVLKKHGYKCMTKTHTKSHTNVWKKRVQMYDKKSYASVLKKHAYKCMTKTHTKSRIQMYEKNLHTKV